MFSLNIQNDNLYFRDIKPDHLPLILNWYNKVDNFKYATGIDSPISLGALHQKYAETAICKDEFFAGIYSLKEEKMIGILKGRLKYKGIDTVWISSIVIDNIYQQKGYGKSAIFLLLDYLKINNKIGGVYLAVIEENAQGREFWKKQSFQELRKMENYLKLQNRNQNVIIMYKKL